MADGSPNGSWGIDDEDRPRWDANTDLEATFEYAAADGSPVYSVEKGRKDSGEKVFRMWRPNLLPFGDRITDEDKRDKIYSVAAEMRVLFNLPALLKAPAGADVYFVEGEKDAQTLIAAGLLATTVPCGAGKWEERYAEPLVGKNVIILPDCDERGEEHAAKVKDGLTGHAASARILRLPGLKQTEDVTDWFAAGHKAEDLKALVERARAEAGLKEWDAGTDDWAAIPPRRWLLGNVYCRRFVSSLIADGGVGKTALRLLQGLALATGRNLTGDHVFGRGRVLFVSLEDDEEELRRRVRAAMLHHGIASSELKTWLFLSAPGGKAGKLMTVNPKTKRPSASDLVKEVERAVTENRIDLLILDPLVKAHEVEENDNTGMDAVIELLANMAARLDIAIDLLHHTSKGAADPGNADRGRGASAVKNGARLVYTLTQMSVDEAQKLAIPEHERRLYVRVDSGKVNITPPLAAAQWFKLVGVPLDNGDFLHPSGDSVQTLEKWTPPHAMDGVFGSTFHRIIADIDAGPGDDEKWSAAPRAQDNAAWRVVQRHLPDKSEAQCRAAIQTFIKNGTLIEQTYHSKKARKDRIGLAINREANDAPM